MQVRKRIVSQGSSERVMAIRVAFPADQEGSEGTNWDSVYDGRIGQLWISFLKLSKNFGLMVYEVSPDVCNFNNILIF